MPGQADIAINFRRSPSLSWALLLSILTHVVLLSFLSTLHLKPSPPKQTPLTIRLNPPLPSQTLPKQMVSPSQAEHTTPNETNFRSDEDSSTPKEQIHRGLPDAAPPTPRVAAPAAKTLVEKKVTPPAQQPAPTKLLNPSLKLDEQVLEKKFAATVSPPQEKHKLSDSERAQRLQTAQPFERLSQPSLFSGESGSPDFLPEIPDGDVTLLNAKADHFAVFVRRVAYQVFGKLRENSWQQVSYGETRKIRGYSTIFATMSLQGKLLEVTIRDASGSVIFDRALQGAVQAGAWDQNPPADAATSDGKIHFVFLARTWSRPAMDGLREQRWIMLSTGLL